MPTSSSRRERAMTTKSEIAIPGLLAGGIVQHHESAGGYRGVGVGFDCLGRERCCIGREPAWRRNLVQHEASGSGGVAHGQQCLGEAVGNGGLGSCGEPVGEESVTSPGYRCRPVIPAATPKVRLSMTADPIWTGSITSLPRVYRCRAPWTRRARKTALRQGERRRNGACQGRRVRTAVSPARRTEPSRDDPNHDRARSSSSASGTSALRSVPPDPPAGMRLATTDQARRRHDQCPQE